MAGLAKTLIVLLDESSDVSNNFLLDCLTQNAKSVRSFEVPGSTCPTWGRICSSNGSKLSLCLSCFLFDIALQRASVHAECFFGVSLNM